MAQIFFVSQPLLFLMLVTTIYTNPPANNCSHPMADLMKMSSGIDITKLDLFTLMGASNKNHGFVANVFDYTCSGNTFRTESSHSLNKTEAEYDAPDHVNTVGVDTHSSEEINFVRDMADAKQLLLKRLGLDYGEERVGAFSGNSKYTSLLKQFYELDKVFAEITLPDKILDAYNLGSPSQDFIQRAKKLPAKYEDNPSIYREFVQHFGTHYFEKALFTYNHYILFALNRAYVFETEYREIEENMKQSYIDWFKINPRFSMINWPISSMLNDELKKNGEIILAYGDNDLKWVDKVVGQSYESRDLENFRTPVMSKAELQPMDELINLIKDNTTNNSILQSQVKIAIRMYRIEAYLAELKNVYNFSADYQLSDSEKRTLDKVEKLVNSYNVAKMNETVEMIDELYNQVHQYKVKQFYDRLIYDAYISADVRLQFAKRICRAKWMCPERDIVDAQREFTKIYKKYDEVNGNEELSQFMEKAHGLSVQSRIYTHLGFNCALC